MKRLLIYAGTQFIADKANVQGCGCAYSDWYLKSEVQFDYFSVSVHTQFLQLPLPCVQLHNFGGRKCSYQNVKITIAFLLDFLSTNMLTASKCVA